MNKIELASKKKKCQLESVSGSNYQLQPLDSPKDEKNELQQFNLTNQIHTTQVMPLSGGSPRKPRPETKQKINTNISKETFINISCNLDIFFLSINMAIHIIWNYITFSQQIRIEYINKLWISLECNKLNFAFHKLRNQSGYEPRDNYFSLAKKK